MAVRVRSTTIALWSKGRTAMRAKMGIARSRRYYRTTQWLLCEVCVSELEYVPVPFFEDNYAWLITDGRAAIVVDPGDAGPVIRYCEANHLKLAGILVTHHHFDHV